ncbi:TRAPP trafficking subunit Trs65-domain-containing protein [Lentinula aff. detonsa]|uniref:TRAPP trafficking subunit Trs65-domain-containing protein n=1 Tax=Lentinula aff. detonsa TaxID=2804958 RepID=A0AA38KRG3_9AGAR|nr:TRAPP trafficking subunit Trs65-domain-containing protein [Lentinula aff. detonsa]
MSFEDLFTSSELDVIVPESSITFPPGPDSDEWLDQLNNIDRKEAFFDEHLQTLFTLRVQQPELQQELLLESPEPSRLLLDFLAHVQVLLEASYISPIAPNDDISEYTVSASPLPSSRLNPSSPPPRTSSIKKPTHLNLSGLLSPNPGSASHHPSILPPSTPNPTPASAAVDQRYLQAEGVVLTSRTWGQDVNGGGKGLLDRKNKEDEDSEETGGGEGFYLLWSKRDRAWVAVYKTVLNIAFLRLNFESPLLCLTFSATLRDKPLAVASSKSPLAVYLKSIDGIFTPADPHSPTSPSTPVNANNDSRPAPGTIDSEVGDPLEINLLAGLYAGPTFAPASSLGKRPPSTNTSTPTGTPTASRTTTDATELNTGLALSTTRLGPVSRAKLFSLPPIESETPTSSAMVTPTPLGQSALPSALSSAPGHYRHHTLGARGKPVLRKSFRKILETASGFKVRMRTVFVPAVLLDEAAENEEDLEDIGLEDEEDGNVGDRDYDDDAEGSENDDDPDRLTSGASERTVVLCVEIETEGDPFYRSPDAPDFVVEKVDISITGSASGGGKEEGATARLIGWDTANSLIRKGAHTVKKKTLIKSSESRANFPLFLAPHEQHNLLYAVSFLHSPQEDATLDGVGLAANLTTGVGMNALPSAGVLGPNGGVKPSGPGKLLQRGVTIEVYGKPCYSYPSSDTSNTANAPDGTAKVKAYHYPTPTFISRWNCVLDLSLSQQVPRRDLNAGDDYADYGGDTPLPTINALPEPPSPFPVPVSTGLALSASASAASLNFPASSSFPSIASVVSPNDRRALGSLGFGLDLGMGSGNRKGSLGLLPFPSASGPATTSMATTEKRHTLPNLPRILPSHVQSAGPGLGHNIGSTIERPGSALGPSREQKDGAKGGVQGVQGRQRRDSLPVPSLNTPTTSKYTPPSVSAAITTQSLRSPTTYEAPPPPPFKDRGGGGLGLSVTIPPSIDQAMGLMSHTAAVDVPPMTPAYPAFPNTNEIGTLPPHNQLHNGQTTPISQGPLIPHGGNLPPNSANLSAIGYVGPSVEVKRERGIGIGVGYGGYGGYGGMGSALGSAIPSAIPQTPAPVIGFGTPAPGSRPRGGGGKPFDGDAQRGHVGLGGQEGHGVADNIDDGGVGTGSQSIVVSVGILPQQNIHRPKTSFDSSTPLPSIHSRPTSRSGLIGQLSEPDHSAKASSNSIPNLNFFENIAPTTASKPDLIYPLSTFILDIFVFNRSTWTRRFEISCPDLRTKRKRREIESFAAVSRGPGKRRSEFTPSGGVKGIYTGTPDPGVLPLENRVRIGPLLPSACQSVRMKFLAVSPGVHSIDTLTLTDVESGLAMNLRSVMDVVVHEPA